MHLENSADFEDSGGLHVDHEDAVQRSHGLHQPVRSGAYSGSAAAVGLANGGTSWDYWYGEVEPRFLVNGIGFSILFFKVWIGSLDIVFNLIGNVILRCVQQLLSCL